MKKQNRIYLYVGLVIVVVGVVAAVVLYSANRKTTSSTSNPTTAAEAIREAQDYKPPQGKICTQSIVRARHVATGAEYTFSTGCIPDGWEPASGSAQ